MKIFWINIVFMWFLTIFNYWIIIIGSFFHYKYLIFETIFKFDYFFEETQTLRFDCFGYDSAKKHELIGSCTMEVGEVLHAGGMCFCCFC